MFQKQCQIPLGCMKNAQMLPSLDCAEVNGRRHVHETIISSFLFYHRELDITMWVSMTCMLAENAKEIAARTAKPQKTACSQSPRLR